MRTLLLIIVGAALGLIRGGVMGHVLAWACVVVMIFTSPQSDDYEHSFGLLEWLFIGGATGAGIGAIVGGVAGYQSARLKRVTDEV